MTPRVTVLVPVYRGAEIVGKAIESVLTQTFEDFELLLVDDCSPDDSVAVIESYDDPRIRLLRNEENLGQIGTLNRGLREARGAYIARLDQDDRCLPKRLELQVAILDAEPSVALVGGWMTIVDEAGNRMAWLDGRLDDYVEFLVDILTNQLKLGHPAVTFRREAVLALGGYDESIALAEDKDLWRRLALAGHEARIVTEPVVLYLMHAGQQSQQSAQLQQDNNNRALERFIGELSEQTPARAIRLLLSWEDGFWAECRTREDGERIAEALEALLADVAARLRLTPEQAAKLDRLIRARVALAARRSWRSGVTSH
jgi:GT2 family glycosyltransferase